MEGCITERKMWVNPHLAPGGAKTRQFSSKNNLTVGGLLQEEVGNNKKKSVSESKVIFVADVDLGTAVKNFGQ